MKKIIIGLAVFMSFWVFAYEKVECYLNTDDAPVYKGKLVNGGIRFQSKKLLQIINWTSM